MKKRPRFTVAVTGMNVAPDNPAPGVAVIHCLRQAFKDDVRIIGLGYDAFDAGMYIDNYCDAGYLLPYPRIGLEAYYFRLNEIQQIEHIDLLIPCLDAELPLLTKLTERLFNISMLTFLPNEQQLSRISKNRLSELAKIVHFDYPEIKSLFSTDFFESCSLQGWNFPIVVKGLFYDARIIYTPGAGITAFNEISSDWGLPILVQRYIKGEEYNLTGIGDGTGKLLGEVMMKKVAVTQKNKACVGVSMYDKVLLNAAKKIIKELQWRGPFELEVMRDSAGIYHLIELNPRFPAWISLSEGVGRNLPARLLEMAMGDPLGPISPPRPGTYFVRYAREQMVSLQQIEAMVTDGHSLLKQEH